MASKLPVKRQSKYYKRISKMEVDDIAVIPEDDRQKFYNSIIAYNNDIDEPVKFKSRVRVNTVVFQRIS